MTIRYNPSEAIDKATHDALMEHRTRPLTDDPFAGSGTTLCVAEAHGRNAIGIDLDPRNADLVPLRRQEVRRNLFGSPRVDPAQLDLFGGAA